MHGCTFGGVKIADSHRKHAIVWGTALAGTAVILGALGAHALKPILSESQLASYLTAVRYQILHALALLVLGAMPQVWNPGRAVQRLLVWGTLCFSGSIYGLVFLPETTETLRGILGPVTPIGGVLLISGWFVWCYQTLRVKSVD